MANQESGKGSEPLPTSPVPELQCTDCGKTFAVHLYWDPEGTGIAGDGIAKLRVSELPSCCGPLSWSDVGTLLIVPETAEQVDAHKRRIIGKALSETAKRMAKESWDRVWDDVCTQLSADLQGDHLEGRTPG